MGDMYIGHKKFCLSGWQKPIIRTQILTPPLDSCDSLWPYVLNSLQLHGGSHITWPSQELLDYQEILKLEKFVSHKIFTHIVTYLIENKII